MGDGGVDVVGTQHFAVRVQALVVEVSVLVFKSWVKRAWPGATVAATPAVARKR